MLNGPALFLLFHLHLINGDAGVVHRDRPIRIGAHAAVHGLEVKPAQLGCQRAYLDIGDVAVIDAHPRRK